MAPNHATHDNLLIYFKRLLLFPDYTHIKKNTTYLCFLPFKPFRDFFHQTCQPFMNLTMKNMICIIKSSLCYTENLHLLLSYNCVYRKQGNVSKWLLFTGPKLEDDFTLATKKLLTINKIEIINNPQKLAQVKKKDIRMTNWSVVLEVSSELFLKRLFCVSLRHVVKGFEMQTHFPILLFG